MIGNWWTVDVIGWLTYLSENKFLELPFILFRKNPLIFKTYHYDNQLQLKFNITNRKQKEILSEVFLMGDFIYNYYLNKSIQDYQQNKDKKWNKYNIKKI